jgi:hypothetical protein
MVLEFQTRHHILKNTAVQNVNKPFVYITDLISTLSFARFFMFVFVFDSLMCSLRSRRLVRAGEER